MVSGRKSLRKLQDTFTLKDVGSTLLDDLAKGLYQPSEVTREYIQNAVDAHRLWMALTGLNPEGPIQIEIRNDGISILDYGIGMDEDEICRVKSIALSSKRDATVRLTGHKGVGIWAGLSYFEKLTLYSTKRGVNRGYQLTIQFRKIVDAISDQANISDVLNPNYDILEFEEDPEKHYTDVTLEAPTRAADFFLDANAIREAVRRICPCEIDPTFVFQPDITAWYERHDLGLFQINVDGSPVYRSFPSAVDDFEAGPITINDTPVAEYWRAINKVSRIITPKADQLVGFRLYLEGFAIGGQNQYSEPINQMPPLKVESYLDWHIGEIHVTTPELRPNLPRKELEESELKHQFVVRLRNWYQNQANKARVISEIRKQMMIYDQYGKKLTEIQGFGAPMLLALADKDWLEKTRTELQEQENRVQQNKRKKDVHYQVEALREPGIQRLRKSLIKRIEDILPAYSASTYEQTTAEAADAEAAPTEQTETDRGQKDDAKGENAAERDATSAGAATPGRAGASQQQAGATKTKSSDTQTDGAAEAPRSILVDVALGLFSQVLTEEFATDPLRSSRIMDKLRQRINSLMYSE